MPTPTWLDYARLCAACYDPATKQVEGGWGQRWVGVVNKGFKGAIYRRANGSTFDVVCAFAGTDSAEDGLADIGFAASPKLAVVVGALSPALGILIASGHKGLAGQMAFALEMVKQAQSATQRTGGTLYLTGHSLGGGLAQIVAAELGGKAAPISSPAVSQLPGLLGRYASSQPSIVNLRVQNDPINATEALGSRLGTTVRLMTARDARTAHFIKETADDLSASGCATVLGSTSPL